MPDHVHLLLLPAIGGASVTALLASMKSRCAQEITQDLRSINSPILDRLMTPNGSLRVWQPGGGYDRAVYLNSEFSEKLKYIHANPVRRGLVLRAEDWWWSSARSWAGSPDDDLRADRTWKEVRVGQ